ncbi:MULTISPECIES: hypothetical protein [Chryseobacterium]|uniref:Uncharacterized protein n=1 Tax=Chryseobacterium nakagawai TaxID=1241982 RepID=A0AAD0YJX5_CHRNA|nr:MULTISPECIES: hypothetical protein [Chryseobacterium]AZA90415.1 hypothetical protein EG343_07175 [Chryseobacterium nakagawai]VEH21905.1 Uncharacterised protein [Chryseobacterium nakagawai]
MKSNLFLAQLLLLGLLSCKSEKTANFEKTVTDQEQIASNTLIGKNGYEIQKNQYLIKKNFEGALTSLDQQEQLFNSIIKTLSGLSTDGIKESSPVKTTAIGYYKAMKNLFLIERLSIEQQQQLTFTKDTIKIDKAQDSLLQIDRKKLDLYKVVAEKQSEFQKALKSFNQANNL